MAIGLSRLSPATPATWVLAALLGACMASADEGSSSDGVETSVDGPAGRRDDDVTGKPGLSANRGDDHVRHSPGFSACSPGPRDPGRATLHRLNRAEYNNTVRDLLGDRTRPADSFPADDYGYGFDNIADVLSVSPLLVEKLEVAAEQLVARAMVAAPVATSVRIEAERASANVGAPYEETGWLLWGPGNVSASLQISATGDYELSARAFGHQAGAEPAHMRWRIDGAIVADFDVSSTEAAPSTHRRRVRLAEGTRTFTVEFTNDLYEPENPDPAQRDRNLIVDWFGAEGPMTTETNGARQQIVVCSEQVDGRLPCARTVFATFGRRAWRRPLTDGEVDRLTALASLAWQQGESFDGGLGVGLQAILLSPHFLYRVELDPDPSSDVVHSLSPFELAARLSYFLWSSMPDDTLLDLAADGSLADEEILRAQVGRLLDDERAEAFVENFGGQWLQTRAIDEAQPDARVFPGFDAELRAAFRAETTLFFRDFVHGDVSALDMFDANYTHLNDRLATHYGLPAPGSTTMQRVTVDGRQRGGLLTHGGILTVTSRPTRTSPVKRGKWVLEQLLCSPPPPPPPGVEGLVDANQSGGTLREKLEEHRSNPVCASCHQRMDPLGFGLDNFDGVGAWRTEDHGAPLDTSGRLPDGRTFTGPRELASIMKQDPETARCLTEKVLTYAIGRGVERADACAIEDIESEAAEGGLRFRALLSAIVTSDAFTSRRGETN